MDQTQVDTDTSNTGISMKNVLKQFAAFGIDAAKGGNARPAAARVAVDAAMKLGAEDINSNTAKELWTAYQKGLAKARGVEYAVEASAEQQISKLNSFVRFGCLTNIDPIEVFDRASDLLKKMSAQPDSGLKGSAYDNLGIVARAQLKQPDVALTEDEMRDLVTPSKDEKTALQKLEDLFKAVRKAHDWCPAAARVSVEDAVHALEAAITESGGVIPQPKQTKAAAQEELAMLRTKASETEAALAAARKVLNDAGLAAE